MGGKFLLNYNGKKYEDSHYIENVNYEKYDTIVECFCGTFGFSRYLYSDLKYKNKKYVFIDNDSDLIDFYNHIKILLSEDKFKDFLNEYNEINNYLLENYRYSEKSNRRIIQKLAKPYINEKIDNKYLKFMLNRNLFSVGFSDVSFKRIENFNIDFLDLIEQSEFIKCNMAEINYNIYDRDRTLFYLDPPYILDCNQYYKETDGKFNFFDKIIELMKKNNTLLIHSYNCIVDYVFRKWKYGEYIKKYKHRKICPIDKYIIYFNNI